MNLNEFFLQLQNAQGGAILLQLLYFITWCSFILLLVWLTHKAINRTIKDSTMRYHARKVARYSSYGLILLLAVITFTGKVEYFGISIGLFSAGVAFALQEVILSIAGWVSIFSSDLYKTGDRIEINKVKGDVIDIGITKTTLMEMGLWVSSDNYTGRIVEVSNSAVFKEPVYNYSRDFPFLWDEISLPIRYGSDVQLTGDLIKKAAHDTLGDYAQVSKKDWADMVNKYLIEDAIVEPTLALTLTDNWLEFNLRYVVGVCHC